MAHAATVQTPSAASVPSAIARVLKYGLFAAVGFLGVRFFTKDAVPYLIDHTPEQFGYLWEVRWWLIAHIAGGTTALLMGPFQFWSGLRRKHMRIHKLTGKLYLGGVTLGASVSIYLAVNSPVGADWSFGLLMLAAAWVTTSGMAISMIRRGLVDLHKDWMIRSYVVTFAFVTFRWWTEMPWIGNIFGESTPVTMMWAAWVIPLGVTEVILQLRSANRVVKKRARAATA